MKEAKGEGLILNLVDIISFFDREDIVNVIEALEDMKVNKKVSRLWYKRQHQNPSEDISRLDRVCPGGRPGGSWLWRGRRGLPGHGGHGPEAVPGRQ